MSILTQLATFFTPTELDLKRDHRRERIGCEATLHSVWGINDALTFNEPKSSRAEILLSPWELSLLLPRGHAGSLVLRPGLCGIPVLTQVTRTVDLSRFQASNSSSTPTSMLPSTQGSAAISPWVAHLFAPSRNRPTTLSSSGDLQLCLSFLGHTESSLFLAPAKAPSPCPRSHFCYLCPAGTLTSLDILCGHWICREAA